MTEDERAVFEFGPVGRSARGQRNFWIWYTALFFLVFGFAWAVGAI